MKIHPLIGHVTASIVLLTGITRASDSIAPGADGKPLLGDELALRRGHPLVSMPAPVAPDSEHKTTEENFPRLPEGTVQLDYRDFFKMPVGSRGLETTDKLRSLDGKRVRVLGYMVKEDHKADEGEDTGVVPGRFLLTHTPASVSFPHYGVCDDLPPQTVFVTAPDFAGKEVPYTPKPIFLTGTLSVGNKDEPEGRISVVRLTLDRSPALSSVTSSKRKVSKSSNQIRTHLTKQ